MKFCKCFINWVYTIFKDEYITEFGFLVDNFINWVYTIFKDEYITVFWIFGKWFYKLSF